VGLALVLFGVYYACTDGVLAALASSLLPDELRATGLSALTAASSIARLAASILFGALWWTSGVDEAVWFYAVGLAVSLPLVATLVLRTQRGSAHA
jgi:hypothetical protein